MLENMSKPAKIILITGASGSGKTTILKELAQNLSNISINHFDDIGVPSFEEMISGYGSCEKWQENATHVWMEKLSKITDKQLVFLEGSFNPEFAISHLKENYFLICLCAERSIREERLKQRGQLELVTQDMEIFAQMLKAKTLELGGVVVDTSKKDLSEIIEEITSLTLE